MRVIALGTGANSGVPELGCGCVACRKSIGDTQLRRKRSSIAIETERGYIIFDASPDIKWQLIENDISPQSIHGIFLTHLHTDHFLGLFEFTYGKPFGIPVFSHREVIEQLTETYPYLTDYLELLDLKDEVDMDGVCITHLEVDHTPSEIGPTLGYKIIENSTNNSLVYIPDLGGFSKNVLKFLDGTDVIIIDGTFYDNHRFNHVSIEDGIKELESLAADIYFTHINHSEIEKLDKKFFQNECGEKYHILNDNQEIIF